jgi:hypothetical protein
VFGTQNHASIDRCFGLIRRWDASDAAAYEGARLREGLLDKTNTASAVWADTAYRSKANEEFLARNGFVSRIHRKKPPGRPMPETTRQANALKSKVGVRVEHVFAVQKDKNGPLCPHRRHRQGDDEDRHGQHRLQHEEAGLPEPQSLRLTRSMRRPQPRAGRRDGPETKPTTPTPRPRCYAMSALTKAKLIEAPRLHPCQLNGPLISTCGAAWSMKRAFESAFRRFGLAIAKYIASKITDRVDV